MHAMFWNPRKSWGAHIEGEVATLDTWLPEQVAFIRSMGNEKSNRYWEAELPPNYDRVGIENFIRAKYEEKRWVPKDGRPCSPSKVQGKVSLQWQRPAERTGSTSYSEDPSNQRKSIQEHGTKTGIPATRISLPQPPKGPESTDHPCSKTQQVIQKAEPVVPSAELVKEVADAVSSCKVDFATDLFDMVSMDDGPAENGSKAASTDDNLWEGFQSAGEVSTTATTGSSKPFGNATMPTSGIEDLFKESSPISQPDASEKSQRDVKNAEVSTTTTTVSSRPVEKETKPAPGLEDLFKESSPISKPNASDNPQKDVKKDIMSLFKKVKSLSVGDTASPCPNHQQQLAMLAQQHSLLMATVAKSSGLLKFAGNGQQPVSGGTNLPNQPNAGCQIPGMMTPALGKNELEKYQQQQLAMLAQQQSLFMAAAAKSGGLPKFSGNGQQPISGGATLPNQNWPNVGNQIPGTMMPALGKNELEKYLQQRGNMGAANPSGNSVEVPTSSIYTMTNGVAPSSAPSPGAMGQNASFNSMESSGASKLQLTSTASSASPSQSAKDCDFSSLTQGMFPKR